MVALRPTAVGSLAFLLALATSVSLAAPPGLRNQTVAAPDLEDGPWVDRRSIVVDDDWADHDVAPNRALIRFRSDLARQGREDLLAEMKATVVHSYERLVPGLRCIAIEEGIGEFLERYRFRSDVLDFIEPDYVVTLNAGMPTQPTSDPCDEILNTGSMEINSNGIACVDLDTYFNYDNWFAKSYDLTNTTDDFYVNCIDLGVHNGGTTTVPLEIVIFTDTDGGEPQAPGIDLVEIPGSRISGGLCPGIIRNHRVSYPTPIRLAAGGVYVVEMFIGASVDGSCSPGCNPGPDSPTYIRTSHECGIATYVSYESLGYPGYHWAQQLIGSTTDIPCDCPGDSSEDCEPPTEIVPWGFDRIDAQGAWDEYDNVAPSQANPLVAILDTGIDLDHEDLLPSIWRNEGEIPGNNIDDDGNGYVDDALGYNTAGWPDNYHNPNDVHGHGTHVAGTIGARHGNTGSNGPGTAGVCPRARLMAVKVFDDQGVGNLSWTLAGLAYAAYNGAKVANMSLGTTYESMAAYETIEAAGEYYGMIIVAAAGNSNNSARKFPAGYDLNNIISVASIDRNGERSSFSNYGSDWVDLGAPGSNVYSTTPNDTYSNYSGTSMAAPHVAGVVAMLYDLRLRTAGGGPMADVINAVLDAAKYDHPLASMNGITSTGGELNARSAITRFLSAWSPFQCSQLTYEGTGPRSETWCNLYTDHRAEMLPLGPDGWHGFLPNCGTTTRIAGCDASVPEVTVYDPYMFEIGGFFWEPGVVYTISGCHPAGLDLVTQMTNCGFEFVCAGPPPDGCDSGFSYQMMGCLDQDGMNSYRSKTLMVGSATRPEPELVRELRVTIEASYPGDLNDDDRVDGGDLALLLADWGECSGCPTDFDRDGVVDGSDMAVILGYWGEAASPQTCASATPIELDTPTTFTFGPLDEDLAVGGCGGIDDGLRSVNWYSFTATSTGDVRIDYQHDGPAQGLQMGFVVMESCDVGSRIACSTGDMYTPNGSCFHFWADAGRTYIIAAGTSAYATPWPQGHANHAPTSGSGVITLSPN